MIFTIRQREYTEADIRLTGEQHGADGILYYPPSVWGTSGGWASKSATRPHVVSDADKVYHAAYVAGRRKWFDMFGVYPATGYPFERA